MSDFIAKLFIILWWFWCHLYATLMSLLQCCSEQTGYSTTHNAICFTSDNNIVSGNVCSSMLYYKIAGYIISFYRSCNCSWFVVKLTMSCCNKDLKIILQALFKVFMIFTVCAPMYYLISSWYGSNYKSEALYW